MYVESFFILFSKQPVMFQLCNFKIPYRFRAAHAAIGIAVYVAVTT